MTVIAYRDGVLAADSAFVQCDHMWGTAEKIWRRDDGTLIGAHGTAGFCEAFKTWVMDGEEGDAPQSEKEKGEQSDGLIVRPDGSIEIHTPDGVIPFKGPFYAMGSGEGIALGAMASGMSAAEAAAMACEYNIYCGGPVTVLRHTKNAFFHEENI